MRVLLDENLDRRVVGLLGEGIETMTVKNRGWSGKTNGELLAAVQDEFDVLLTMDRGIPHQQNLEALDLAVVLVRASSNRLRDIALLVDELRETLRGIRAGDVVEIGGAR